MGNVDMPLREAECRSVVERVTHIALEKTLKFENVINYQKRRKTN